MLSRVSERFERHVFETDNKGKVDDRKEEEEEEEEILHAAASNCKNFQEKSVKLSSH